MRTAMKELIEKLAMKSGDSFYALAFYHDNDEIIKEALEKEKEQIIESFDNGIYVGTYAVDKDGEQYYNQTYNQDRELPRDVTELLENYKKDKTFKQKSKWI
jgi:hypothetical protein